MAKITNEELQNLYENFETTWLLDAVGQIDEARCHLGDDANYKPPQIRCDLFKLHELAMSVINNGSTEQAQELFNMAFDLEMQVSTIIESLENVYRTLGKLTDLYPQSLLEE
jgi:hypothetical protein